MSRKHRANISVEGLECRVTLSSIAPGAAHYAHPRDAATTRLEGSLRGSYLKTPNPVSMGPGSTIQLGGSGIVSPLGVVNAEGTISARGGDLTLRGAGNLVTETCILTATGVVESGTDVVETFSYTTTDGLHAGTFVLDLHQQVGSTTSPPQSGTFDARFC